MRIARSHRLQSFRHRRSTTPASRRANARRTTAVAALLFGLFRASAQGAPPSGTPRWAVAVLPSGHEFSLEVAADAASRENGYMFRDRIGEREGMIFVFESSGRHSFWMKNCRTSLDIVWLDAAFRVVDMAPDQKPCPATGECPSVEPAEPARYVVEFAGGTAMREKLKRGDPLVILAEPSLP